MNFHVMLSQRAAEGRPVRVGLIGADKFGSMFLSQARRVDGSHVLVVVDLTPDGARENLRRIGWEKERYSADSFAGALKDGSTHITDDAEGLIAADGLEVAIDATGSPSAGIRHVKLACRHKRHIVISIASAAFRGEPTGAPRGRRDAGRRRRLDGLGQSDALGGNPGAGWPAARPCPQRQVEETNRQ